MGSFVVEYIIEQLIIAKVLMLKMYLFAISNWTINKGYLLFLSEHQIYFIECALMKILMFSAHEIK